LWVLFFYREIADDACGEWRGHNTNNLRSPVVPFTPTADHLNLHYFLYKTTAQPV